MTESVCVCSTHDGPSRETGQSRKCRKIGEFNTRMYTEGTSAVCCITWHPAEGQQRCAKESHQLMDRPAQSYGYDRVCTVVHPYLLRLHAIVCAWLWKPRTFMHGSGVGLRTMEIFGRLFLQKKKWFGVVQNKHHHCTRLAPQGLYRGGGGTIVHSCARLWPISLHSYIRFGVILAHRCNHRTGPATTLLWLTREDQRFPSSSKWFVCIYFGVVRKSSHCFFA